jgi:DNA repair protein SbcC/Rad50
MIIRSIRLKNIKSYGEGENNHGITVDFQSGVNRIAGRNGHGKSTLIEAIGFALFLAKPNYEETFAIDTYLLRNGAKEGEIDVTFEYKAQVFRIERGMGKASKRRTKIIDPQDDSICAEGDAEVSDFLRRLLGLPSADNLSEIFSKLIGVKQGRLTWPFDSKPSQAKKFFEPLFDVAVFRDCFDKLKPSRDQFADSWQKAEVKIAGVNQKIADRADSQDKLKEASEFVARTEKQEKEGLELVKVAE